MSVPVVDCASYTTAASGAERTVALDALARTLDAALTSTGFVAIQNIGVDPALRDRAFAEARRFFASPMAAKQRVAYSDPGANFGYQAPLTEALDPGVAPDLKESFTMRDLRHRPRSTGWPDERFRRVAETLYEACYEGSMTLLQVFAEALGVSRSFFVDLHSGENATLRFLHYPNENLAIESTDQMGAGAHTDYGALTLLFQDQVGGLQLLPEGRRDWLDVPPLPDAINVNTGDLMTHWSNGRYPSTLHRVLPKIGGRDRYSIAFFCDPDSTAPVRCLDACVSDDRPAQFADTTAGDHIQQRILASQAHVRDGAPQVPPGTIS